MSKLTHSNQETMDKIERDAAERDREPDYCAYPFCKCIVSTSTLRPEPKCPLGLAR